MFAPAGAAVATLGVQAVAWILHQIRDRVGVVLQYSLDWNAWPGEGNARSLLLWEAFVSGAAHSDSHERDAATAAVFFRDKEQDLNGVNAVMADQPLSMVHAVALWAGWASDLDRLHQACLVLRPEQPYEGQINPA
jgi:hypothetical protein